MSKAAKQNSTRPRLRIAAQNGKRARGIKAPNRMLPPVPAFMLSRVERLANGVEQACGILQRIANGGYGDDPVITRALAESALCETEDAKRAAWLILDDMRDPEKFWGQPTSGCGLSCVPTRGPDKKPRQPLSS